MDNKRTRRTAYRKSKNLVEVTLDLLTSDLFNAELPIAMNFGSLGFIVSHAMVRAFGKTVRKYDGRKHPKQWTKEMIGIQEKKLQCFKNQFQNYTGEADLLFDHDFARTVGLNIDFETFQNVRNGTIDDLKLPGLENLHMDKLFFITFAMNLCENIEPEFAIKAYSKGLLPKSVILNAAVSNSEEFARTFQCKRGDILWKDDKCNYF